MQFLTHLLFVTPLLSTVFYCLIHQSINCSPCFQWTPPWSSLFLPSSNLSFNLIYVISLPNCICQGLVSSVSLDIFHSRYQLQFGILSVFLVLHKLKDWLLNHKFFYVLAPKNLNPNKKETPPKQTSQILRHIFRDMFWNINIPQISIMFSFYFSL